MRTTPRATEQRCARDKSLTGEHWDDAWLASLELAIGRDHGAELAAARARTVASLDGQLAAAPDDAFASAAIALEGSGVGGT